MDNFKTLFRLYFIYAKMDLLWFLRDLRYCLLFIVGDVVSNLASVTGVFLLAMRFEGFGEMNQAQLLFMLGYGSLVNGIYGLFFANSNTGMISRIIGRGQLDHYMIQPTPFWIQMITEGVAPFTGSGVLIMGIALTSYAVVKLELVISVWWICKLIISVICSAIVIVSCIYIVSYLAFYAPSAAEEISMVVQDMFFSLRSYPLGGISILLQSLFCTAIPIGIVSWFPSMILLEKQIAFTKINGLFILWMVTAIFLTTAVSLFCKGLKHYRKNGSPRYSSFGRH